MEETESNELSSLLQGCLKEDREAQRRLYKRYYGYAMSICLRYSTDPEEARDVLNDGFLKVFTKLQLYDPAKPFKNWVRRIMINTALDNYRHNLKHYHLKDIEVVAPETDTYDVLQQINYEYLISLVQALSPAYRAVFNLYAIDGHTHEEIAKLLGISVGTSKSNLSKARVHLRAALSKSTVNEYKQHV